MTAEPLTLGAAFAAGLLGSGHCLGMCGGMALLPGAGTGSSSRVGVAVYNLSRLVSYALLGAGVGALGASIGDWLDVPRWSLILRVATGAVIVMVGLAILTGSRRLVLAERLGARLWQRLAPLARRMARLPGTLRLALLGGLWGLLPCGLVYSLLLAASVSGSALDGGLVMLAFGAGTLPSMAGLGVAGRSILQRLQRPQVRVAAGILLVACGLWLAGGPVYHTLAHDGPGPASSHSHH